MLILPQDFTERAGDDSLGHLRPRCVQQEPHQFANACPRSDAAEGIENDSQEDKASSRLIELPHHTSI
jgi:hypothetical protein